MRCAACGWFVSAVGVLALGVVFAGPGEGVSDPAYVLDVRARSIDGEEVSLERYGGKVVMIVNVASRCGLTPQYESLQRLHEKYGERGFVVLAFPANDFANQEPGSNKEIARFCREEYGVTFPVFAKIGVLGEDRHELYARLAEQPAPIGGDPRWNFTKFLVDRSGRVVARFEPRTSPEDGEVVSRIEALLGEGGDVGSGDAGAGDSGVGGGGGR